MTINETYKRCQELLDIIYKEADEIQKTVIEAFPDSDISKQYRSLAKQIIGEVLC